MVPHHYIAPGSYTITLTVKDGRGATASFTSVLVAGNPGEFSRQYEWEYNGTTWYWTVSIPK